MKKLFIFTLCMLITSSLLGEERVDRLSGEKDEVNIKVEETQKTNEKDLSDSFMDAFGMGSNFSKDPSAIMTAGSATAVNQVTTPFTPHMPK